MSNRSVLNANKDYVIQILHLYRHNLLWHDNATYILWNTQDVMTLFLMWFRILMWRKFRRIYKWFTTEGLFQNNKQKQKLYIYLEQRYKFLFCFNWFKPPRAHYNKYMCSKPEGPYWIYTILCGGGLNPSLLSFLSGLAWPFLFSSDLDAIRVLEFFIFKWTTWAKIRSIRLGRKSEVISIFLNLYSDRIDCHL